MARDLCYCIDEELEASARLWSAISNLCFIPALCGELHPNANKAVLRRFGEFASPKYAAVVGAALPVTETKLFTSISDKPSVSSVLMHLDTVAQFKVRLFIANSVFVRAKFLQKANVDIQSLQKPALKFLEHVMSSSAEDDAEDQCFVVRIKEHVQNNPIFILDDLDVPVNGIAYYVV